MKTIHIIIALLILAALFGSCKEKKQQPDGDTDIYYSAIEFNNVLCGYSVISLSDSLVKGNTIKVLRQNTFFNFTALGKDVTQFHKYTYFIDTSSGNFIYHDSYHKQGNIESGGFVYVEDGKIRVTSLDGSGDTLIPLPENVVLPNTQFFPYLIYDFGDGNLEKKTYQIFEVRTQTIAEITYTRTGEEQLDLTGSRYDAVVLTESNPATGLETKLWIDKKTGKRLKMESQNHLRMYLAEAAVQKRIETGNWDEVVFMKTNRFIKDIHAISYMKIKCNLEQVPAATKEDLNVPGQTFTGHINGNKLEGIFEIAHKKYDGKNPPSFPLNTDRYEDMGKWLKAEGRIESNDPVLVAKAKEITTGSQDLWDASRRISQWVIENIDGSILGGTARETFDRGNGACGSQSLLMAALCRAAGIPARVVWGSMYTHEMGGSFGQHAWNEIFMGDAGWIPVDVTFHEADYVDSGHLRLGVLHTQQTIINFSELEIMEFKTGN